MRALSGVAPRYGFLLIGLVLQFAAAAAGVSLNSTAVSPELRAVAVSDTQIRLEWDYVAPEENVQ